MNPQLHAVLALHDFLVNKLKLKYALIGGLALQFWGEPRFTHDVDLTVQDALDLGELVKRITGAFESRVSDPMTFARETRMLLLSVEGVDVNVAVALQGYEESLFERCKSIEIDPGRVMQICSAEDLIIHKALACRSQDFADIQGVIYRQGSKLDVRYIRSWLRDFSQALGDETILDRFEKAWGQR